MRKRAILGILGLASILLSGLDLMAFTFEAHPGLYTSYEYTDNYLGSVRNHQSENTYYIGPSLRLACTSPSANFDLIGSYAKTIHKRFTQDDSPEIHLASHASFTLPRQTIGMAYGYDQTWTREYLNEPFGKNKSNTGSIGYTAQLTQSTSISAGGNILTEDWSVPHEVVTILSHQGETTIGGNVGVTHQLTLRNTISLTARQDYYNYEISPDVVETVYGFNISHAVSPLFSLALDTVYNHYSRETLPVSPGQEVGLSDEEDIYDVRMSVHYALGQSTTMIIGGGYSWLIIEGQDLHTAYLANASLEKIVEKNRFSLQITKQLVAEFTSVLYGNYDSTIASLLWERQWVEEWSTDTSLSIDSERPIGNTPGENETSSIAHIALNWEPIHQFTAGLNYDHLQTKYETTGTARENRYRVTGEVRY